jgi:hypothetical protein
MPYESDAQRRYFHANENEIGKDVVKEFDKASKGKKLPEKVSRSKKRRMRKRKHSR